MEYQRFLQDHSLKAGDVLNHILRLNNVSKLKLSKTTGILPQRISDYTNNNRRLSPQSSLAIEKALGIDYPGFFYLIQANHDIFTYNGCVQNSLSPSVPDLTKIKGVVFWDTDITKLDWQKQSASIIKRIFEYGDSISINEIINFYGGERVIQELSQINDPRLAKRRLSNQKKFL